MFLVLLILSMLPPINMDHFEVHEEVDLIEVNLVYSSDGCICFQQVIFWRWYPEESEFHVAEWRHLSKVAPILKTEDGWRARWKDEKVLRNVTSKIAMESRTWHDIEVLDREKLSISERIRFKSK